MVGRLGVMTNPPSEERHPQGQDPYGHNPYGRDPYAQDPYAQASGYPPQGPMAYAPDHPKATTSLILGILGVVLCQALGPFAWVIGKRTVNEIDASNGTVGGRGSALAGYVLGIIATVLLGLGLLVMVGIALLFVIAASTGVATNTSL